MNKDMSRVTQNIFKESKADSNEPFFSFFVQSQEKYKKIKYISTISRSGCRRQSHEFFHISIQARKNCGYSRQLMSTQQPKIPIKQAKAYLNISYLE